jgi:hypothetical protein
LISFVVGLSNHERNQFVQTFLRRQAGDLGHARLPEQAGGHRPWNFACRTRGVGFFVGRGLV